MTCEPLFKLPNCEVIVPTDSSRTLSKVFCCDMLSIAMSKAPADGVWVTVMGNKNTLAVATLADVACIIFAEGVTVDDDTLRQAKKEGIAILYTTMPIFETALAVHNACFV